MAEQRSTRSIETTGALWEAEPKGANFGPRCVMGAECENLVFLEEYVRVDREHDALVRAERRRLTLRWRWLPFVLLLVALAEGFFVYGAAVNARWSAYAGIAFTFLVTVFAYGVYPRLKP